MSVNVAYSLDGIITALDRHQQRATYSAVAALLDQTPRLLMHKQPREQRNSWIVSKTNGRPTGYADDAVHPELTRNERILATGEELAAWLVTHEQ
jgi:hypothetical protein